MDNTLFFWKLLLSAVCGFCCIELNAQNITVNLNPLHQKPQTVIPATPISIGSRLELFVDNYLIEKLADNAELKLHHPKPQEIAIVHDAPWEGAGSGYHSIFKDGDKYRMYYKAWQHPIGQFKEHGLWCSYAESFDGINWTKPNLGLYEFQGSKQNNIVFRNGVMDGVDADGGHPAVFKDENPNVTPDALYKAILVLNPKDSEPRGLVAFKSPDGIHWSPFAKDPIISASDIKDGAFDSQNLAFWDEVNSEYRAYWRTYIPYPEDSITRQYDVVPGSVRSIATARSKDMINWSEIKDLMYVDSPPEHLYTNVIKPYYRAPHLLIGFPSRYVDRGWSESMRELPELKERKYRASEHKDASQRYGTVLTEALLMSSRDGVLFDRWNEAFLRPGIERKGTWNYGHQYIAWSVVETKSTIVGAPNELSLYAVESYWTGTSSALRRYTLRIDGFVSVSAPMSGGELITKPLTFSGEKLNINFSSSAVGDIQIEIQDEFGTPIPGFTLSECLPIFGDSLERTVTWKNGSDVSSLEDKVVRLRFRLKDANLYSIRFN